MRSSALSLLSSQALIVGFLVGVSLVFAAYLLLYRRGKTYLRPFLYLFGLLFVWGLAILWLRSWMNEIVAFPASHEQELRRVSLVLAGTNLIILFVLVPALIKCTRAYLEAQKKAGLPWWNIWRLP